ncbi:MAG: hypothetical protein ACLQGU_10830 [bacterium]
MRIRGQFHESDFAGMGYPVILALPSREGSAPDCRWIVQPADYKSVRIQTKMLIN